MSNTGNLDYSLNKNSFYTILKKSIHQYIRYYFILVINGFLKFSSNYNSFKY